MARYVGELSVQFDNLSDVQRVLDGTKIAFGGRSGKADREIFVAKSEPSIERNRIQNTIELNRRGAQRANVIDSVLHEQGADTMTTIAVADNQISQEGESVVVNT